MSDYIKRRDDVNPDEGEREYGNVQFADPTNNKYPIDSPEHVRAYLECAAIAGQRRSTSKSPFVGGRDPVRLSQYTGSAAGVYTPAGTGFSAGCGDSASCFCW